MFFPHLMNINKDDVVLEIGPGAYPFWRSDCLADIFDENSEVDLTQFGGKKLDTKGKPLFKITNNTLPFKDKSFDYIICSHVFEHVPIADLPKLANEIMRVSNRAYIEFPRILYDYIYNLDVHVNIMDIVNGQVVCCDKIISGLRSQNQYQKCARDLRRRGHFSVDENYASALIVGKEFVGKIPLKIVATEHELFEMVHDNPYHLRTPGLPWKLRNKLNIKRFLKYIFGEKKRSYFLSRCL